MPTLITESRIDFPASDGLCLDIWMKNEKDRWVLKPSVRKRILDEIELIQRRMHIKVTNVRIIGSICTNLFGETSDIDVHMSVTRKFKDADDAYKFNRRLQKFYGDDESEFRIKKHPVQFFVQHNYFSDLASVGVYSVTHNRWFYGPTIYDAKYDPFTELKSAVPAIKRLTHKFGVLMSDLEVALKNYVICCKAENGGFAKKSSLFRNKAKFSKDIENACRDILDIGEVVKLNRRNASTGVNSFKDAKKFRKSKTWHEADATMKYMERYGYLDRIHSIREIVGKSVRVSASTIYDLMELLKIV